jgi:hypothetical protein
VNNVGNNEELLASGALECRTYSRETYVMTSSMDGTDVNGGRGGWRTGASTTNGCDGIGGGCGCPIGETNVDGWDMKYGGGEWR